MQNNNPNNYIQIDEINIRELLDLFINSKKIIIVVTLFFSLIATIYAYSLKPNYEASSVIEVGFYKNVDNKIISIENPKERVKAYEKMVTDSYKRGKAINMASHFELDDVIDPAKTRDWILGALKSLPPKTHSEAKRRPNIATW